MIAAWLAVAGARGALFTENFNGVNTAIPSGNPTGIAFNGTVSDVPAGATVQGLTVSFVMSGGYNGYLYAYVVAPNGTKVVLLNQPENFAAPFSYGGAGFNVTLADAASSSIQTTPETYGVVFSGTYSAAESLAALNGSGRTELGICFLPTWPAGP